MILDEYEKIVLNKFAFLENEYGFTLEEKRREPYGCFIVFQKGPIAVKLGYEDLERRLFYTLKDENKQIMFWEFFKRFDESINWPDLMPMNDDYEKAIEKNILLLKKYGRNFLSGNETL